MGRENHRNTQAMRESTIEKAVRQFAKDNGCIALKLASEGDRGKPDRLFLKNGKVLFIEFKKDGAKPDPLQLKWQTDLRAQGFAAEWTDNIGEGMDLIATHLLT